MNRRQFAVLLVLVALLGVAGLILYQQNQTSWQSSGQKLGQKLLGDFPVNDVAQIVIKSGTNELTLAKKEGTWRVRERSDYPANFSEISGLLLKLADLKVVQSEEVGPSQLGRYQLLPPGTGTNTATLVEFLDQKGKTLKTLLLGKTHLRKSERRSAMEDFGDTGWPDGRYVMVGRAGSPLPAAADGAQRSAPPTVALITDPLTQLEPKPEPWLDKDFFKVSKTKAVSVEFPATTNSWKVTRDTESAEWKLADAKADEKLDSSKVSGINYALSSPSFADVLRGGTNPEQTGLDKPTVITLQTFDNFTYTLKVGSKTNDDYALTVNVTASLPQERTPGKDEKAEDKDKLDKEFKVNQKKLEEKLTQEQAYAKWIYLVSSWTFDSLLKERTQILEEKKEEPPESDASTNATTSAESPTNATPSQPDEAKPANE